MNNGSPIGFLEVLLRISAQGAVLVMVVMVAQWIFRRRLTSRWRSALWWVVLARLLIPISLPSPLSLFNLVPWSNSSGGFGGKSIRSSLDLPSATREASGSLRELISPKGAVVKPGSFAPQISTGSVAETATTKSPPITMLASAERKGIANLRHLDWPVMAIMIWGLGAALISARLLFETARLTVRMRGLSVVADRDVLALLDECRVRLGLRKPVALFESGDLTTPALVGAFRPRIVLPSGFTRVCAAPDLRFVFLHELAHVQRRDLVINWVVALVQVAHWFNPLIWIGFARWRADRELACDARVIEASGEGTNLNYGRAILRLLEGLAGRALAPGLVGILEDKRLLRERIEMIASFTPARRWGLLGGLLLMALALVGLTDAQLRRESGQTEQDSNASRTNVVSGQILAEDGYPVPGAFVFPDNESKRATRTDSMGRFVCKDVSLGETFRIWRIGYFAVEHKNLAVSPATNLLTLFRTMKLRGAVNDVQTGRPINQFSITAGAVSKGRTDAKWIWEQRQTGTNGAFEVEFSARPFFATAIGQFLVEAPGYEPALSRQINLGEKETRIAFDLRKGQPMLGVLVQPDGQPAESAKVTVWNGELNMSDIPIDRWTVTGPDGRYRFDPMLARKLLISHPTGWGEVTLEQLRVAPLVKLKPGGRVTGTLRAELTGGRVDDQRIWFQPIRYKFEDTVPERLTKALPRTDSEGRFSIENVPEGDYWIGFQPRTMLQMGNGIAIQSQGSHLRPITVRSGASTNVDLIGEGRVIVGKAAMKDEANAVNWEICSGQLNLKLPEVAGLRELSRYDYPEGNEGRATERGRIFSLSPEGKARQRSVRTYIPTISADGTFRIDNVPPGNYRLYFSISGAAGSAADEAQVRSFSGEVLVGEGAGTGEPLDLGTVRLARPRKSSP